MLIAMAGLPGSGKSTIADAVGLSLGIAVLSVDPIESAILSAGIDADQPTGLAAYLVADKLASSVLAAGQSIIIDAVNAVDAAREQWVHLAAKRAVPLVFLEVVCSDAELHRARLEARERDLPHFTEPTWHQVEQSLDEYATWTGESGLVPRLTIDSAQPVQRCVEQAVDFLRS